MGGHRLFLQCAGTGSPTVVFLHGVGGASTDWSATLTGLSGVRTCNYDRLNAGRSDIDPGRHTAADSVEDLNTLLDAAGIEPPLVLAGHSFGGMLALMEAGMHPDDVAGILLIDATLPLEADLDPPELRDEIEAELDDNPERLDFYDAFAAAGNVLDRVPPVPITYLFGTLQKLAEEWAPGAYEKALHRFIESLPRGRLVEEKSGHDMPYEIPEEIAAEIRKLLLFVRKSHGSGLGIGRGELQASVPGSARFPKSVVQLVSPNRSSCQAFRPRNHRPDQRLWKVGPLTCGERSRGSLESRFYQQRRSFGNNPPPNG